MLFTELIAKEQADLPNNYFVIMFATMFTGMIPVITTANIITEEKDKNTLRVLRMSNVKPIEYLLGIGSYVFFICILASIVFGVAGEFKENDLLKFIIVVCLGVLTSIILGAAIGILAKNQMSASSIVVPVGMFLGFIPMIEMFNDSIKEFSKYLYTQQINYLINDLSSSNFTLERFIIIGCNVVVFFGIFVAAYRKGNLV